MTTGLKYTHIFGFQVEFGYIINSSLSYLRNYGEIYLLDYNK